MGTRNTTLVKLDGDLKVSQYGQWDGYPTGQGQTIVDFLKTADLDKFKEEVRKLREITQAEIDEVNEDPDWAKNYPYLSRDAGADILNMIAEGSVQFIHKDEYYKEPGSWVEYVYTIDLDENTVRVEGHKLDTYYTFEEFTADGFMEKLEEYESEE